jgi:hypothetical protein
MQKNDVLTFLNKTSISAEFAAQKKVKRMKLFPHFHGFAQKKTVILYCLGLSEMCLLFPILFCVRFGYSNLIWSKKLIKKDRKTFISQL